MLKRLLATVILVLAPAFALADDAAPTPTPAATPAAASAAGLGPQTSGQSPVSTGLGNQLQPAGSALQAAPTSSNGLSAASSNTLQAPATNSDQLKVLLGGEADGAPQDMSDTTGLSATDDVLLGILFLVLVAGFFVRRRQLATAHRRYPLA